MEHHYYKFKIYFLLSYTYLGNVRNDVTDVVVVNVEKIGDKFTNFSLSCKIIINIFIAIHRTEKNEREIPINPSEEKQKRQK